MGPQLGNNLFNLGIEGPARKAMESLGLNLDELIEARGGAGLGNGAWGRLAAVSWIAGDARLRPSATAPYEFGIFDQEIVDGGQRDGPDRWLPVRNPWEVRRFEIEQPGRLRRTDRDRRDAAASPRE